MPVALPKDLEDWARAEVAAGRADSVDALAAKALGRYRRSLEAFRHTLDDAVVEADRDGWIGGDAFLAEIDQWIAEDESIAQTEKTAAE